MTPGPFDWLVGVGLDEASAEAAAELARAAEAAAEGTRSAEAATRSTKSAAGEAAATHLLHLSHQAVHLAHQSLHLAGHLALLEAGLESVLGAALTGATEVARQSIAVGAAAAAAREGSESTRSARLSEGATGACKGLGSAAGETGTEAVAEGHGNADRSSAGLVVVYFINSTHRCNPLLSECLEKILSPQGRRVQRSGVYRVLKL